MRVVPIRFGRPEFLGTKSNFENAGKQTGARVQRELAGLFVSGQKKGKKNARGERANAIAPNWPSRAEHEGGETNLAAEGEVRSASQTFSPPQRCI